VPARSAGRASTIQYIDHQQGLPRMLSVLRGAEGRRIFLDGQGWAVEQVNLPTQTAPISMRRGTFIRP